MSEIITAARDLLATIAPMTGTRATGVATVTASSSDVDLYEGTYALPTLGRSFRDDLVVKVGAGPNTDDSGRTYWTVTSSGTDVSFLSNIGGARHNTIVTPAALTFDPPITGIASVTLKTSFTGGADPTGLGALYDAFMFEQFEGDPAQLAQSNLARLPAALIIWRGSDAADGSNVSQVYRMRVSGTQTLMKETFDLLIFTERNQSEHLRRLEGLYLLDLATGYLTDRGSMDGNVVSAPAGVQVQRRFKMGLRGPDNFVSMYVYGVTISVMKVYTMTEVRTFNDLDLFVLDMVKHFPAGEGGDIAVVGDGLPGKPGMEIDNT